MKEYEKSGEMKYSVKKPPLVRMCVPTFFQGL